MKVKVLIINAFDINGKGGNPAGIVFNADNLTTTRRQTIASRVGLPETAFVSASSSADYKLDFFTPVKQIPHCGHATIGTFSYLKNTGQIKNDQSSKETIDGNRSIVFKGSVAFMEQRAPKFSAIEESVSAVLSSLSLQSEDLIAGLQPTIVNTGNSFLIIPLKNEDVLRSIYVDRKTIISISAKYELIGYYPFTFAEGSGYDAKARMFAPYYGIEEEAATGMAAGPLASFLHKNGNLKKSFLIGQGYHMSPASPSSIQVDLETENDRVLRLFVGGTSYVSGSETIEFDSP